MSFTELLIKADEVFKEMQEHAVNVEKSTREQRNSKIWTKMRARRITASNFHQICHTNPAKPSLSLIKQICYGSSFQSAATDWGIRQGKRALDEYRKVCSEKNAFLIYMKKNNKDTGEIPPLIDLLQEAISNLSLFYSKIFNFDLTNNLTCHHTYYEDINFLNKKING